MRAMVLRTPVSDPNVDFRMKGKVDLADVRRTMKFEGIDQLTGTVAADAAVRTRLSYIDKKQYDKVAASGSVDVGDLTLKGKTLPRPLAIQQASLRLRAGASRAQVVPRLGRQQRSPGDRLARQPDRVRVPGRHPSRHRDGAQPPVQSGRVAIGRG